MTENRESFFTRLEPFLSPSVILDVQLAYTLAKFGHRSQFRKELDDEGAPLRYFEHPRRVAISIIDEVKIVIPELIIPGLMHDVFEDAPNLPPAMIEHCFGSDIVTILKTLSKTPKEGYDERFMMCNDWRPFVVKACDRLDNLRSLPGTTIAFRTRQVSETRNKYYTLFDRMIYLTPPVYQTRIQMLRDHVMKETERQAVLIETTPT